ncbi:MAG: LysR substrate-binding domain-containing protein, partial [Pseudomonadota bacterium]
LSINNGDALVTAALDGLGLTISPNFIAAEHLKSGALVEVMTRYAPPPIGVFAVYPPGRFTQPKQRAFIDHFADTLKGKGPRW